MATVRHTATGLSGPASAAGTRITAVDTHDIRFPTSCGLHGSDATHPDPDYSAAYVIVRTDAGDGLEGHGFCFTIGRGNEIEVAAIDALRPRLIGAELPGPPATLADLYRTLADDGQMRWLGPEKGVTHMAVAAVMNALWDLTAKRAGKPLWKLLSDMSPEELVALADFRYLADTLTPGDGLRILRRAEPGRAGREARLRAEGYPAYLTSCGWLGYDDDRLARTARAAVADGFTQIKLKVGGDPGEDIRRCRIAREAIGPDIRLALDANQRWEVGEAVERTRALARFDPYWIEEPTSPDEIIGLAAIRRAVAPVKVAAGEHAANRVIFKQLLEADALDVLQLDACRVGGVNENLAILLLAAEFGVPVWPHAGGVGLCELVRHLAMFDYVAVSGTRRERAVEYVDHLHEHFLDPAIVTGGRYRVPTAPGFSSALRPEALRTYAYPDGAAWR